jgi:6-phosphogluconolactonase
MSLEIFADAGSLAEAAADRVLAHLAAALAERGRATLALSGGRTPEGLHERLASEPRRARLDWSKVAIYFADERAVPPDDLESNFRMARVTLIDPLGIAPRQVHRMKGEYADLDAAVDEYAARLPKALDVVVLGVGEDGHVASLFPRHALLDERDARVAAVTDSPKPPPRRLTLTPPALADTAHVLVLASGAGKAGAVAAALAPAGDVHDVPARLVREREWLVDRAAAALAGPATP